MSPHAKFFCSKVFRIGHVPLLNAVALGLLVLLSSCNSGGGTPSGVIYSTTADSRVSASTDDVEETADGSILRSSPDLNLVGADVKLVGLRFTGVGIPAGAAITDAYVSFTTAEVSSENASFSLRGVARDDPPTFISARANVSSQPTTTAAVTWSPAPWPLPEVSGAEQQTANLAPIIQELVDRPGWSRGNALALVISGSGARVARSFDGSRAKAPLLHVNFTADERVSIDTFSAQPAKVQQGREVTFSWSLSAAGGPVRCTLDADGDGASDYTIADCLGTKTQTHSYKLAGYYPATLTATAASGATATATAETNVSTPASVTIAAAGDIACDPASEYFNHGEGVADRCHMKATSELLLALQPDAVLTLGDNQYNSATLNNLRQSYDPTWGRLKAITHPAAGTHEYTASEADQEDGTGNGAGYFAYFGAAAGDPTKGYYSFDLGAWHIVVLNANCSRAGGCEKGSPQEQWLRADLAASPKLCTLTVMHYPRFSSGKHGNIVRNTDFWQALADAGAELVLSGNDHDYERFAPQTPNGTLDAEHGIRQFVVGTGGKELYSFGTLQPHSEARISNVYGVLKLNLHPESYDWAFVPEAGQTSSDKGTGLCH